MRRTITIATCVALYAVLGQTAAGAKSGTLAIAVLFVEPDRCRVEFRGKSYVLPDTGRQLETALKASRSESGHLHIENDMTTPWRCMGEVWALGARAKFRIIGFAAQPPDATSSDGAKVR